MTTEQKIKNLMKDLAENNCMGMALMYERLISSAEQLRTFAEDQKASGKSHVINPDAMLDYCDRVKKHLEG